MSDYYIGQIILTAFQKPMTGWALCSGQTLTIADNQALYAVIGTIYGGDGVKNFKLPNLNGSVPIGAGKSTASGATTHALGSSGGSETVTLTAAQVPPHTHALYASKADSTTSVFSTSVVYGSDSTKTHQHYISPVPTTPTTFALAANSLVSAGGSQPHGNIMPSIGLCYQMCISGIFPTNP